MKLPYPQSRSDQVNKYLRQKMADHFFVGIDADGNRMFGINLSLTKRMPMRQRYDRYVGLLGQVEDVKKALTEVWDQFSLAVQQDQAPKGQQKVSLQQNLDQEREDDDDDEEDGRDRRTA